MRIGTQNVYNPIGIIRTHKVFFSTKDNLAYVAQLVDQTLQFLNTLSLQQLKLQSVKFFKWLVVGDTNNLEKYAQDLLDYFHSRGLLMNKTTLHPIQRQSKQRYVVLYKIGDECFSQTYNSIREIKEDTGLRGRKFHKKKTSQIMI
jgi:hypothetical protein